MKIRNLMSAIFRHGIGYELLPRAETANPMKYVRQSGKRRAIPSFLEVGQFQKLFAALKQRERTMVLLDCGSGLRRGELIGLKWADIDFAKKQTDVTRSVVDMIAGEVKTEASKKAVPLDDFMIEELLAWCRITPYKNPEDLVFSSDSPRAGMRRGKQPYWPATGKRGRSEGRAGTAAAFIDQGHDGRLHASGNGHQKKSPVESCWLCA